MAVKEDKAKAIANFEKALAKVPEQFRGKLRQNFETQLGQLESIAAPAEEAQQAVDKQIGMLEGALPGARRSLLAQQAAQRGNVLANIQQVTGRGADAGRQLRAFETQATGQLAGQEFGSRLSLLQAVQQARQQQFQNQMALQQFAQQQQQLQMQQSAARPTFGKFLGTALGTTVGGFTGGIGSGFAGGLTQKVFPNFQPKVG